MQEYLVYMTPPDRDIMLVGAYDTIDIAEKVGIGVERAHIPLTRVRIWYNGKVVRDNQAQRATREG